MEDNEKHPWQRFLEARREVIDWLYSGDGDPWCKESDANVAETLSMDAQQVRMIRTRT